MKKIITITLFSGLLNLLRMASSFLIAKVVAVHVGPAGMAMIGQLQNMIAMLNGAVCAPAGNAIVRYTAENKNAGIEDCALWWRAATSWVACLLIVTVPVCIFAADRMALWLLGNSEYAWMIVVSVITLPLAAMNSALGSVINGYQKYKLFIGLGMISVVVNLATTMFLIFNYGLIGAFVATIIATSVAGLVMLAGVFRQPWVKMEYWWGVANKANLLGVGGYVLMAVTSAVCVPLSQILVRNLLVQHVGWSEAGYWQAVSKISEAYLGVITIALSTYYLPRLSSITDLKLIKKEIWMTAKIVMPVVSLIAFSIFFMKDIVIEKLFTQEFMPMRQLFALQLSGDVLKILSWLFAFPMLSRGAVKWFVFTEIFFSVLYVTVAFFLIEIMGVQGAIVAYLLNYFLYAVLMIFRISIYFK